ncbi:hypothetical protein [Desulfosporosinus sp. FKA]|uniref:hypothetical protein n=1 Tax=Desulfosporosinus sp. FKA TaxID=1969834 RepID=UPI000B4A182C|nr:hypothetical protein [Desulfosporosinus sp. FKA]
MIKIRSKLILGIISGLFGELAIMSSNYLFVKFGLVKHSLHSMSLQVLNRKKCVFRNARNNIWLPHVISTFFCTTGGILITCLLSFSKRSCILKGFIIGTLGGIIPYLFSRFKVVKDMKTSLSKMMCFLSHGFFGLTVAMVIKFLEETNCSNNHQSPEK